MITNISSCLQLVNDEQKLTPLTTALAAALAFLVPLGPAIQIASAIALYRTRKVCCCHDAKHSFPFRLESELSQRASISHDGVSGISPFAILSYSSVRTFLVRGHCGRFESARVL